MTRHVEGGSYVRIYQSGLVFSKEQLPSSYKGDRHSCTHIYFLLEAGQFSAFHRIQSDELWHFYAGDPLIIYEIDKGGHLHEHLLGSNPGAGESFFTVIKAGSWFASRVTEGSEFALVGCTVSPGFDFADFELAEKTKLMEAFPQHRDVINPLCH